MTVYAQKQVVKAFALTPACAHNAKTLSHAELGVNDQAKQTQSFLGCDHKNKPTHFSGGVSVVMPEFGRGPAGIGSAAVSAAAAATKQPEFAADHDMHAALSHKSQQRRAQKLTKHKIRGKPHLLACLLCSSRAVWAVVLLQIGMFMQLAVGLACVA